MTADTFLALLIFALVAAITPGPNNLMLLASSANFGFRRTVPHMLGIVGGMTSLLFAVGLGLGTLLQKYPALHFSLKLAGACYLLYLAWRIANTRPIEEDGAGSGAPLTFLQAVAFQWVNPKAWIMGGTAVAIYANPAMPLLSTALVVAAFGLVVFPSVSVWSGFGQGLRRFLADPARLKWFNIAMGILLVASLWPLLR